MLTIWLRSQHGLEFVAATAAMYTVDSVCVMAGRVGRRFGCGFDSDRRGLAVPVTVFNCVIQGC